ncbi:thioredoxin family protein [Flavobacterium selenitireducens]|uniref:thioredoxin family protein n=1 Tax=Flavobacterium selenitireducens TaxID=2722704 RepID=UPI00168B9B5E|nr:thioredoxin family protein [Flavobacterium selenitireducens]MBD3581078.1 thioredoxin family protein [Flavobacterium selenitireducens]
MKRQTLLKTLFFILFLPVATWAQPSFAFDESGFEKAMQAGKSKGKPVFYMIYASWCPHCHKMKEEIFPDTEVAALLNQNFHVSAQDVEQAGGRELARKFGVTSYPAFVVLDADANLLYGFGGEFKKPDFIKEIQDASNTEKQLPYLRKAFENATSDGNRAMALILALRKANLPTGKTASTYLATQKEAELISALNWKIIANGVTDISSREFQYVMRHQPEFASVSSQKRVDRKIENIISESLKAAAERGDTIRYNEGRQAVKELKIRKGDSLAYVYDKQLYEKTKNWKAYHRAAVSGTKDFAWNDYATLRHIAGIYLQEIHDVNALRQAVDWSRRSTQLQESKDGYLLTAKLYEKLRDVPNAISSARILKKFCERVGFGTKEADEILTRLQSK